MTPFELVVQLIGFVGLAFSVIAFQCKNHKKVMICRTLNELFFCLQYFLLGTYTGSVMNVISCTRNMIFAKQVEKGKSTRLMQVLFSAVFVLSGLITSTGITSVMVIGAKVVSTIAYGIKDTRYIRFLTLPTSICWLVYNYVCNSAAGVLCEAFTIASIVVAIIRIDILGGLSENRGVKQTKGLE